MTPARLSPRSVCAPRTSWPPSSSCSATGWATAACRTVIAPVCAAANAVVLRPQERPRPRLPAAIYSLACTSSAANTSPATRATTRLEVRITEPRWFRFFDDEIRRRVQSTRATAIVAAAAAQARHAQIRSGARQQQPRPSVSASASVASSTRARSLSASVSVELAADNSGDDAEEDMSPCEADPVEDEDASTAAGQVAARLVAVPAR